MSIRMVFAALVSSHKGNTPAVQLLSPSTICLFHYLPLSLSLSLSSLYTLLLLAAH